MLLKDGSLLTSVGYPGRTYDISPDGQRFLLIKATTVPNDAPALQLVVVQHFDEMLKRLVPTN
jgi:hypothetical protein